MNNNITRTYKKSRIGEYNGKILYSLNHNGEVIKRTSSREYFFCGIIDWCIEGKWYREITWSCKPVLDSTLLRYAGFAGSSSPYRSSAQNYAIKKRAEERYAKARENNEVKISQYGIDPTTVDEHKAFIEEWNAICERNFEKY